MTRDVRTVTEAWPAKNRLSSESSYEIDPEDLFHAFTYAERNGLEVIGFYHSHPFWSADASEIDKARANYPGLSYLIYSIPNNEMKSFYFDGKRLNEEPVMVTTGKAKTPRTAVHQTHDASQCPVRSGPLARVLDVIKAFFASALWR